MGWGVVPGHGPFLMRSVGKPITVGDMEVRAPPALPPFTLYQQAQCICARSACTIQLGANTYLPCTDHPMLVWPG